MQHCRTGDARPRHAAARAVRDYRADAGDRVLSVPQSAQLDGHHESGLQAGWTAVAARSAHRHVSAGAALFGIGFG